MGVAVVVFEMRRLEKLNIRIFLFRFKTMEMHRRGGGINLYQERCFQT